MLENANLIVNVLAASGAIAAVFVVSAGRF